MSEDPFVSVVVAARDAETELPECLASLVRVDYPPERHEVLVVDNASRDATAAVVKKYPVTLVSEPRIGVSWARNAGIAKARGEIVALTDPDCLVSTTWLRELVRPFADSAIGAVAGAIVPYPPRTAVERYAARRRSHSELRPLADPARPFGMTPNLAVRRELLGQIGGFDVRFRGGGWEDADLCWRLTATGANLGHAPRAVVFHRYRSSARAFLVQHYRYGYGLGMLARKYGDDFPWSGRPRADLELQMLRFGILRLLGQQVGYAVGAARAR